VRLAFLSVLFESTALPEQYPLERFVREWTKRDEEAFARSLLRGRWLNALQRTGVSTVGEVSAMSERRLLEIPQVGPKAVADTSAALRDPRVLG
jgi:DNA-directed RNA polymerase alpha subunit